jgi:hypothetical protein
MKILVLQHVVSEHPGVFRDFLREDGLGASTEACPIQSFRYGEHAYGLQFHVEVTKDTVSEWASIPAYAVALEKALGRRCHEGA